MNNYNQFPEIAKVLRYWILRMTTQAGSGHVTSSLSSVELMAVLFFKYFHYDFEDPNNLANDRLIFSKGHASPLYYSLFKVADKLSAEELMQYRTFESTLEGHPTMRFPFCEAPTGSLGQGLSVGVGEALALRNRLMINDLRLKNDKTNIISSSSFLDPSSYIYVLLGDGEIAEGQVWEAFQIASHYKLNNLIAILDVNGLGQSQSTLYGFDVQSIAKKIAAFGWRVYILENGHDTDLVDKAYSIALEQSQTSDKPAIIIAKTIKGKGVTLLENKVEWHGRVLNQQELDKAIEELGLVDKDHVVHVQIPNSKHQISNNIQITNSKYMSSRAREARRGDLLNDFEKIASSSTFTIGTPRNDMQKSNLILTTKYEVQTNESTRKAFGEALVELGRVNENIVVLDGDVQNSSYTHLFAKEFPRRFYQMFIAEQNMLSSAVGMSKIGLYPVISTFSAFLSRAFDQIRIACLSGQQMLINGTHGGVSIGQDGPSQMGLEDIAMFRNLPNTTVLYPADGNATVKLLHAAPQQSGIVYLRTQRPETAVIYDEKEEFEVGGSKVRKSQITNHNVQILIIAVGITVIEALKAQEILAGKNINATVIDCYSIKPIDTETLIKFGLNSKIIITVEDHYLQGGLGDAVLEALTKFVHPPIYKLGISKTPHSGTMSELLDYEGISGEKIAEFIKGLGIRG